MKEPKITIGQDIVQLVADIDEFKGRWQASKRLPAERLQQLRNAATVESVGASTRIAGAKLTDAQVEALLSEDWLADASVTAHCRRDEEDLAGYAAEVKGYAEALELVLQTHQDLELTLGHIQHLHQVLLRDSTETDGAENDGQQHMIKSPETEDLVSWASKAFNEASMHPLLITAIFKVAFLAIRPFQDGNGRLSRILTTLLLLRAGYDYVAYTSLDGVIEKDKAYYHKALKRTQSTLDDDAPNWQPWFAFFLRCLKMQKAKFAPAVEYHQATDSKELPQLSMGLLVLLSQHHSLSITQLAEMTGTDQSRLKPALHELTNAGHIQQHGEAESNQYSLPL